MDTLILTKIILGLTLAGDVSLLLFVLREQRSVNKLLFALFLVGITGWTSAIFINLWAHSIILEKYIFAFAALFLTAQVLFTQLFPGRPLPLPRSIKYIPPALITYWSVLPGAFFLLMSFWNGAVFSSLRFDPHGYTIVENGFFSSYYSLFALAFVAAPVLILIRTLIRAHDISLRSQLKYLIVGFSIFLGVNILTNSILPVFFHIFFFNAVGPVFSLILAGFVFYIIWQHQFLDIRIIIERGLIYAVLIIVLIESYFDLLPFLEKTDLPREVVAPFTAFVLLLLALFVLYAVERYFQNKELLEKERVYARALEDKVRERTANIETMRARERQLMEDISHAQQTSLTILKADVERLKQEVLETSKPVLDAMEQGIDRSSLLMRDLLRVAHLEMQQGRSHDTVDLSALARKVVEYVDIVCSANDISLAHYIESNLTLTGDAKQLEELFLILLSNSVKYKKSGVHGTINLHLVKDNGDIVLTVADSGIGIAEEHLPFLFDRFYRARTGKEGNGLGLAIAKAITESHGGSISVKSVEGEGSEFIVRL